MESSTNIQTIDIDKYATNESLYMLQSIIKPYVNSKKHIQNLETKDTLSSCPWRT